MRVFLFVLIVALHSCNSGGKNGNDDPDKQMDDTARMDTPPPVQAITPVKVGPADIPVTIKVKGRILEAWQWTDKAGEKMLVTSYVAPYDDKRKNQYDEEGQTAELYASLFQKKGSGYEAIWTLADDEKACPFDITCGFIENATTITDLDADGLAEVKLQYSLACRSDVSPAAMKLVLYENADKYSLKGLMWVAADPSMKFEITATNANMENAPKFKDELSAMYWSFGRYESERDFANAPAAFLDFARKEWVKYAKEKMGE